MHEEKTLNHTRILSIRPPEAFAETLGYDGPARKVAFYWGAGDEAYYSDGFLSTQAEWDAYLLFIRHPLIVPELQGYNLGTSEEEATHWLLLDRDDWLLTVLPSRTARQLLLTQWWYPAQEQGMDAQSKALEQFIANVTARTARIRQEHILAHMMQHQAQVQTLATWLEMKWKEQHMSIQSSKNN